MPYIILRRTDIPDAVLQTLDLRPNTSQRKFPYQPASQTGYRVNPQNEAPTLTAFALDAATRGLSAWLLANVSSGAGVAATGSITTDVPATFGDGDTFTISDGTVATVFEFIVTAGYAVASPNVAVDISAAVTANDVRDVIIAAINGELGFNILAANGGASTVALTNTDENITAAARNVAIVDSGIGGVWATAGMAGATNSDALTAAEAIQDATDILTLVAAGGALNVAAINGALTDGTATYNQIPEILDVLAGRTYTVPAGTLVQAAGAFIPTGSAAFWSDDVRHIRMTSELLISLGEGRLALATGATFTYAGVAGAALTVYEDDGTVLTVPA